MGLRRQGRAASTALDKIRHGSHTLGANRDLSGKEDASADQEVAPHRSASSRRRPVGQHHRGGSPTAVCLDVPLGMTSIIVADQLTKWFGPRLAVDHVSLQVEGVASHRHGDSSSALVQMRSHGAWRLRRALESLGYDVRKIIPATSTEIPADCAVVVDVNPRTTYLPGESDALLTDLAQGGAALLLYDLGFVQIVGGRRRARRRDRPLDHYSTRPGIRQRCIGEAPPCLPRSSARRTRKESSST